MDAQPSVGDVIRRERKAKGWKQQTLAAKAGITQNYVSSLENGTRVGTLEVLQAVAGALEIPLSELLDVRPALPETETLPPVIARAIQRLGQYLTAQDWDLVAAYMEGRAAERAAFGYRAPEVEEPHNEVTSQETA